DDDVLPDPDWPQRLAADLGAAGDQVGGVQGVLRVPQPADRAPTDWERVTAGLADSDWITADMAYRRAALACAGGFDERFPRAFREDAELAYRVRREGWSLRRGRRTTVHPVRPESPWVSLRSQRGNADDALLRRLYGPRWREHLEIPPGRRGRHTATTAAGLTAAALGLIVVRSRRPAWTVAAGAAAAVWAVGTTEFAAARILPGPREGREVATMLATSVAIPPFAVAHWLRGWWRWRDARPVAAAPSSGRTAIGTAHPKEMRLAGRRRRAEVAAPGDGDRPAGKKAPGWRGHRAVGGSGSAVGGTVRPATRPARTAR
ncbi:MAG: hypothetical protein QOH97_5178, partial [Actinoplanes sp.]|nr:hypothetical protein [Actinoplanes sp.]